MGEFKLRDYQKQIIAELKHLPSYALYMSTGTGKTITSLHIMKYNPTSNLLVVCPYSAIKQWKITLQSHFPKYNIIDLKKSWGSERIEEELREKQGTPNMAVVINYDMIHRVKFMLSLVNKDWTIIADEIHRIKNYGTKNNPVKVTRFMVSLSETTDYKIGLSATPTQGKFGGYIDYYTQIRFLGYTDMSYDQFYKKHVISREEHYGTSPFPIKTIIGYKDAYEIDNLLSVIARRYKPSYGDFEPQFNKIIIEKCPNYSKTVREKAYVKDDAVIMLNNTARSRIAKKTLTTGVILGHDMQGHTYEIQDNTLKIDWLEDFLTDTDEVVAIFYTYNVELYSLKRLMEKLGKRYVVVKGGTKDKYDTINNKEYDVVLGQFQAMSEALDGLHLKCHIEVFFSMPESSITYTQALGRIDRIGQTNVPMYYFLVMEKTIDETIMENIENKVEFSEATLERLDIGG